MNRLLAILLLTIPIPALSQVGIGDVIYTVEGENLIENGDFELYEVLPNIRWDAANWFRVIGSYDYFHSEHFKERNGVPSNFCGYQLAHSGKAYTGFALIYYNEQINGYFAHENYGTKLKEKLDPGSYLVEFYYSLSNTYPDALDYFGAGLSTDSIAGNLFNNEVLDTINYREITVISNQTKWMKANLIINATGGEKYLYLGNFRKPEDLNIKGVRSTRKRDESYFGSYYYIDDVKMHRVIDSTVVDHNSAVLFPNPSSNGQFTLNYNFSSETAMGFGVYDATGRKVANQTIQSGTQSVLLNFPSLSSGTYIWRIEQNGAPVDWGKMVISK